jgi:PAS domain S-box-containing protein
MYEADDRHRENESLRERINQLLQQATDTEQAMLALARGEVDAVSVASSSTPVLLHAAQESLRQSELLLRRIFDGALDAMLLADDGGRYVDANPAACELFGLSRAQLLGRSIAEFAAPGYDGASAYRTFQEHGHMRDRFPLQRSDGSRRILDFSAVAGVAPGLNLSVLRDITDRVAAEEALRRSEARFRVMIDKSADGLSLTAADGSTLFRSAAAARILGFPPDESSQAALFDAAFPDDRPRLLAATAELLHGQHENVVEYRARHRDGSIRWIEVNSTNLLDDPDVGAIVGNERDITARKQLEVATRESELRYRRLIEDLPEPILVHVDGKIAFANAASAQVAGVASREELLGRELAEFATEATRETLKAWIGALRRGEHTARVELCFVRASDGRELHLEVKSMQIDFDGRPATLDVVRDVTERVEASRAAAEALRAAQRSQRLQRIAGEAAKLGGWVLDLAESRVTWSDEVCAIHEVPDGYSPGVAAAIGYYAPEHRLIMSRAVAACAEAGTPFDIELEVITAKNQRRWVRSIGEAVRAPGGGIVQVQGALQDITDRKQVEDALRASEGRLRDAQRIASLGSWDWNIVTGKVEWSAQLLALFGRQGALVHDYDAALRSVHPEDRERMQQAVQDALTGRAPYDLEYRVIWPNGSVRVLHAQAEVTRDADGRPVHMAGTALDITERKRAEAHLAETNRALQLLSHFNEALVRADSEEALLATVCRIAVAEGGFRFAWVGYAQDDAGKTISQRASAGVELSRELSGAWSTWSDATPSGQGPAGQVIRSGEPLVISDLAREPGFALWREAASANGCGGLVCLPLKQAAKTFGLLVLYSPDARAPEEHERRVLRELADDLAFGIVALRFQAERRRLQTALQKVAMSTSASTGALFFEQLASNMVEALGAQAGVVARLLPGQPPRARTIAAIVAGQSIAGYDYLLQGTPCEGLADREELIVPCRASELFQVPPSLAQLGAQAYVGRMLRDSAGEPTGILFVLFRDVLESTEFVSSTLQIFATRVAVELERQKADARLREQASLLDKSQDAIIVRDLDHRILYWNRSAERRYGWTASEALGKSVQQLIHDDATDAAAATAATLERGEWVGELHQRHKDGTPVIVEGRWSLVRDDDGTPRSILSVNTDLTERKKLEKAEEQLRQAQKMEAIGSLAGGVAHDFNNILSVILSYADLIITDLKASDPLRTDLEEVRTAGLRAMELTRQLLAFSRKQILQPVVIDLNQVVMSVQKMLGRLLGEDVELTFSTQPDVGRIHADAGQIEQVLMNLVVNARDAMPGGGNLTIETSNAELDESYAAEHPGVSPGQYVLLAVTDTGVGMDRATQARIFEPFFTTKDKSKGTGLGLSTVYGIVQQSGGHIWVYSELGRGTTFKVYLPRSDRTLSRTVTEAKPSSSLRGVETILLVEDEGQVRNIIQTILRKNGYHVLEAQNGGEAFLICEQFKATIHLLLTDVVMPRMSGRQLAERLAPLRPQMKVLFISGYTENTIVHHGVLDAGVEFLAKPIMPEPLLSKVRSVLDQRHGTAFLSG